MRESVWSNKFTQMSWASTETAALTDTITTNGVLIQALVGLSNATNAITVTFTLTGPDSFVVFTSSALAENNPVASPITLALDIPLDGTYTLTVTPSGDPGASGITADIKFLGEQAG